MNSDKKWWIVLFSASNDVDLDSLGYDLIECGAYGTEILTENGIRCFIQCTEGELQEFKAKIKNLPLEIVACDVMPTTNWVQKCSDVWEQLNINKIAIVPVMSLEKGLTLSPATAEKIYIIPGCGFGTGHHPTTNQATAILQSDMLASEEIKTAFDVGTGSGLLAIVVNRLFNIPVDAIDNDPDAVNNAKENAQLNGVAENLNIKVADALTWSNGQYDLVMANLYAELLEKLHDSLYKATNKWLLISGFRSPDLEELKKFAEPLWERVDIRTQDNWSAMLLRKK